MKSSNISSMGSVWLVAQRELGVHLRSKTAIISTALFTAAIVGGLILMKFLGGADPITLGHSADTSAEQLAPVVAQLQDQEREVTLARFDSEDALKTAVEQGDITAGITSSDDGLGLIVNESPDSAVLQATTSANQSALMEQLLESASPEDRARIEAQLSAPAATEVLNPPTEVEGSQAAVGMIVGILLYIGIFGGGMAVAQGVVEEKSSRVIEVLLATVRPWQLLAGKVLGIGLASLIQVGIYILAGVVTAKTLGIADSIPFDIAGVGVWVLVWFLIGFLVYALMFAALGALVSRQEDLSSVIPLPMTLILVAYMIGVTVAPSDPDSAIVTVASYVPFTSPIVMPIRSAYGVASTTEVLIAVVIGLITIPLLLSITAKMYSNGVRRSGAKVKLRDALKAS